MSLFSWYFSEQFLESSNLFGPSFNDVPAYPVKEFQGCLSRLTSKVLTSFVSSFKFLAWCYHLRIENQSGREIHHRVDQTGTTRGPLKVPLPYTGECRGGPVMNIRTVVFLNKFLFLRCYILLGMCTKFDTSYLYE